MTKEIDWPEEREPFNPTDPFDAITEQFRQRVVDLYIDAEKITLFREMDGLQKLESFICGVMTALCGVSFAHFETKNRSQVLEYLQQCLPISARVAHEIADAAVQDRLTT